MNDHYEYDVFIDYHVSDSNFVQGVADSLKNAGLKVWLDKWTINTSSKSDYLINHGLANSRVLILFISKSSLDTSWIEHETRSIRFRDPLNLSRRFVPVLLNGQSPPPSLENILCIAWNNNQTSELTARLVALCSEVVRRL